MVQIPVEQSAQQRDILLERRDHLATQSFAERRPFGGAPVEPVHGPAERLGLDRKPGSQVQLQPVDWPWQVLQGAR
jgi:hypothetical protein